MKLLFDENLSPALVDALADVYPQASHVIQLGMRPTDEAIWSYAAAMAMSLFRTMPTFMSEAFLVERHRR